MKIGVKNHTKEANKFKKWLDNFENKYEILTSQTGSIYFNFFDKADTYDETLKIRFSDHEQVYQAHLSVSKTEGTLEEAKVFVSEKIKLIKKSKMKSELDFFRIVNDNEISEISLYKDCAVLSVDKFDECFGLILPKHLFTLNFSTIFGNKIKKIIESKGFKLVSGSSHLFEKLRVEE